MWEGRAYSLLEGAQTGTAIVEISVERPEKTDPVLPSSEYIQRTTYSTLAYLLSMFTVSLCTIARE